MPAVMRMDTSTTRKTTKVLNRGASGRRGGRSMMSGSLTSKASGRASATAATRLIHSSWVGSMGRSSTLLTGSKGKNMMP